MRIAIPTAVALAILVGVAGFAIGKANAPTEADASAEQVQAHTSSLQEARASAIEAAQSRGLVAGRRAGRRAGSSEGANAGDSAGSSAASDQLAASEAAQRASNCGAPLFVNGYCPTDAEIQQENQAEANAGLP